MTERALDERATLAHLEKLASIGRLAAGVAEEIGNPLGAINNYAQLLRRTVSGNPAALEAVYALERESARIDRILRSLLDYSRSSGGATTSVDLNECVRSISALLADQGALRGVRVSLKLDPDGAPTMGERHELEQVLVNLMLNAADALAGQGRLELRTRRTTLNSLASAAPRREGDGPDVNRVRELNPRLREWLSADGRPSEVVQLVVADSGPGIAAGAEERIFHPFYTTKAPGTGTGLGLAIVARIVESLSGVVWVQRAREGGAAFKILLPLFRPAAIPVS